MTIGKDIRTQINNIKNTQKITSAMRMVAASKMKKAQNRMLDSRPYADKITQIINHLTYAHCEFKHPYINQNEEIKQVGYIVISSDRGLCGGLNANLFRTLLSQLAKHQDTNVRVKICTIGKKSLAFFKHSSAHVVATQTDLGDTPHLEDIIGALKVMLGEFESGGIDKLYLAYNTYVSTMTQKPTIKQLLPMSAPDEITELSHRWDYIYEPDAKIILNHLLTRFIETLVYQGVVENIACEQSARMIAMQSATDNAGDMVKNLQLVYNKARQAAITQEISEIVGGAAAV